MKNKTGFWAVVILGSMCSFIHAQNTTGKSSEKEIQTVSLTGKKKLIERKIDRTVFNVENSIASQGMDGVEALRNTPLIKVDETTGISIIGKSGVSVMINDKIVQMSDTELLNYLKSLRSENIARIEVITTPPAKYDAQGNSGIINIVLKKNINLGWSGNLTTGYTKKSYDGFTNNIGLNYQSDKISSSLKLRHYDNQKKSTEQNEIIGTQGLKSLDVRKDMPRGVGLNYSLDYKISDKSNVGVVYDLGMNRMNMNINNRSEYFTGGKQDSLLTTYAEHRERTPTHTLNVYYDLKLDSLGKKMSVGGNYFSNIPVNRISFQTLNHNNNDIEDYRSYNKINYSIWSGQVDFTLPYKFANIETGGKVAYFKNNSDLEYSRVTDVGSVLMPDGRNLFEYKEQNYAGYFSIDKKFSEQWSAKAGVRYEYSVIDGLSLTSGERNKYEYGRFFPTAYLAYKADDNNTFTVNYSRRINRPFFRAINPYRWYINPYSFAKGNPYLKPSYSDNIELGYSFKSKFTATLYYQQVKDAYSQIVTYSDGIKIIDYNNLFNDSSYGLNLGYYDTLFKFWELNVNANLYYVKSKGIIPEVIGQNAFNTYYNINNTFTLNKQKTVAVFANFMHRLRGSFGNYKAENFSMLNLGAKLSFMEKKLQVNASVNDVFLTALSKGEAVYSNFISRNENYYDYRNFTLSVSYIFGNNKVKGADRNIKFEEKNRVN
ncbi:TonB-dependent receptor [Elizabethkingia meningoseptica]|uniref:TonB-dependent receptor domain-containing protein n=1 Tax=Elizabethkingia meningoseptica TaxID=238 RepID=UPI000332C77A|nr:TonB-dependent receptor [Elizabethkingia meningoseptica]AQX05127.1 TonB-dependent receptor [Elizabethkingia meningoseptica]AQX47171.1 TonB-dependent receptor [Elizabethkingia meningoseptica]EOR30524.1 TonB-dependent receptor [Elizabethkingia meningoseptica ATCC 13253 = NBRC 12535]KUY17854.1 TonB-dependent receptor [Elizabethkingia meningoseptica]OPB68456.1 TonB-dependent receptor [Elizabethkingia meningoseptica]